MWGDCSGDGGVIVLMVEVVVVGGDIGVVSECLDNGLMIQRKPICRWEGYWVFLSMITILCP